MLHLIIYKGEAVKMSQLDKTFCEGFVTYLANAMTIGFEIPKRGQHHQKKLVCKNDSNRPHLNIEEIKTLIRTPCKNAAVKKVVKTLINIIKIVFIAEFRHYYKIYA